MSDSVLSSWWVALLFFLGLSLFIPLVLLTPSKSFSDPLWEIVPTPSSSAHIMRTPVPHGWIVTYKSLARSIVYIPDEKHEWKIK